jgi:hypothetical protein
VGCHN